WWPCFRELFQCAWRPADTWPRLQTGRTNRPQRAPGHGNQLPDLEGSLQKRSGNRRQDTIHERRATHHHWRRAGKISRHFHWLFVQLLGADVDAGDVRFDGIQNGRSRRALDRRVRVSQTRRNSAASTSRTELDRAAFGKRLSGNESRPGRSDSAVVENAV